MYIAELNFLDKPEKIAFTKASKPICFYDSFYLYFLRSSNTYLFLHREEKCTIWAEWKISAAEIVINDPKIIDLFSYKFYVGPHKCGFGIVNYNPRHTYCPLVPKQYTFSATKGSPQILYTRRFFTEILWNTQRCNDIITLSWFF